MAYKYFTDNQERRQAAVAGGVANGIDFLELAPGPTATDPPRLAVRLLFPLDAQRAPALLAEVVGGSGSPVVTAVPPVLMSADRLTLTVVLRERGDAASYTLRLLRSPDQPVAPQGFDPLLSSIDFSFVPPIVSQTDCQTGAPRRADSEPAQRIDYLAKDFSSFRQLMLDRLAATAPEWTERNAADLGMTLVEILAHRADILSYYQDAIATEAYLGTARRRLSVRRHVRLLDYFVHEGCNARTWAALSVSSDVELRRDGTRFLTRCSERPVIPPVDLPALLEERRPEVFEPLAEQRLFRAHNQIALYTWNGAVTCLPRGAIRATLDDAPRLSLEVGDVLIFEEISGAPAAGSAAADPAHRHAVRLTRRLHYTDPANGDHPILDIEWAVEDALPFALCLDVTGTRPFTVARGNVVLVDHGLTLDREELPAPTANAAYQPLLRRPGLTYSTPLLTPAPPAAASLVQEPRAALPAIRELTQAAVPWTVQRDLLHSKPDSREFVVEMEEQGRARLRFGDGILGARPAAGAPLVIRYRVGSGQRGNVGANVIAHVVTSISDIIGVTNPLAATGGVNPEDIDQVRLAAPQSFRTQERAVSEADYVTAAERFTSVRKAACLRRFTGSFDTYFIAVVREGNAVLSDSFTSGLRQFLERFRLNGTEIVIVPPVFVKLDIFLAVRVEAGHLRSAVRAALTAAFSSSELADGRRGFFHPDNFSFGQPVFLGQVVSAVRQVPGVAFVDTTDPSSRFRRAGRTSDELRDGRIAIGELEIATSGTTDFHLEGGL